METQDTIKQIKETSDEALKAKTGKAWQEWFQLLDDAGAVEMSHPQIARLLYDQFGVPGWWCQHITGGYERARGKRIRHEMPEGFQVGASRTLNVPLDQVFKAWEADADRSAWLGQNELKIRKLTSGKSVRADWKDNESVSVNFYEKGSGKSQVTIEHSRIVNAEEAQERKAYWGAALDRLKEYLTRS